MLRNRYLEFCSYFGRRRELPVEGLFALRRQMLVEREKLKIESYNKSRGAQAPFLLSEPEFTEFSGLSEFFNSQPATKSAFTIVNGTERNGTERNGTERNGTERNGTERNRTEPIKIR